MKKARLNSCLVEEDEGAQTPMVTQLSTANKPLLDNDGGTNYVEHVEDEDAGAERRKMPLRHGAETPGVGMGRQAPSWCWFTRAEMPKKQEQAPAQVRFPGAHFVSVSLRRGSLRSGK